MNTIIINQFIIIPRRLGAAPSAVPLPVRSARPSRVRSAGCAPVSLRAVCQPRTVDVRTHEMRGAGGRGARSRGPRLGDLAWPITASGAVPVCRPGRARNTSNRHDPRLSFKPCRQLHNCWRLGSRGSTAGRHRYLCISCLMTEARWPSIRTGWLWTGPTWKLSPESRSRRRRRPHPPWPSCCSRQRPHRPDCASSRCPREARRMARLPPPWARLR